MAVKKRVRKDFDEMSEEDWEDWGERFGKKMERWGERFGEKMEKRGKRFGKKVEEKIVSKECCRGGWWHYTFGALGPLLHATFDALCVVVAAFLFGLVGSVTKIYLFSAVNAFLYANIQWFFLAYLVFSFARYLKCVNRAFYRWVKPVVKGVRAAFAFWIIAFALELANYYAHSELLAFASNFIGENLVGIFVLFAVFNYALFLLWRTACCER